MALQSHAARQGHAARRRTMLSRHAHIQVAFFSRQLAGWWFFMLGRWKLFELDGGAHTVAEQFFVGQYKESFLPGWSLRMAGYFDPWAEFLGGLCLIIGLGVRVWSWTLMGLLVMVTFGHQLKDATYGMGEHVLPAALLLIIVAALAGPKDLLCLDRALSRLVHKKPGDSDG